VTVLLDCTGLVAGYGKRMIFDKPDVQVARSAAVAVTGHNGTGKSTLLDDAKIRRSSLGFGQAAAFGALVDAAS